MRYKKLSGSTVALVPCVIDNCCAYGKVAYFEGESVDSYKVYLDLEESGAMKNVPSR